MAIALVQSNRGGFALTTTTAFLALTTTATGNFLTNTASGDMLALVAWGFSSSYQAQALVTFSTPTTAGMTWVQGGASAGQANFPSPWDSACSIFFATNTAAIASTVSTHLIGQCAAAPTLSATTLIIEFALYEFSGALGKDHAAIGTGNTGGTPTAGNVTTTAGDLVLVGFQGVGGTVSSGVGFTTGISATAAVVGQIQYQLGVAGGVVTTAFGSSIASNYAAVAVSFLAGTSSAAAFGHSFPVLIL